MAHSLAQFTDEFHKTHGLKDKLPIESRFISLDRLANSYLVLPFYGETVCLLFHNEFLPGWDDNITLRI